MRLFDNDPNEARQAKEMAVADYLTFLRLKMQDEKKKNNGR